MGIGSQEFPSSSSDTTFIDWDDVLVSPVSTDQFSDFLSTAAGSVTSPPSSISSFPSPKANPLGDFLKETQLSDFTPIQYQPSTFTPTSIPPDPSAQAPVPASKLGSPFTPVERASTKPHIQFPHSNKRGPGRPSINKPPTERVVRKRLHNDSASRSRARFSSALEKLWSKIPERERMERIKELDPSRPLSRAEKVEIAVGYLRKLEEKLGRY